LRWEITTKHYLNLAYSNTIVEYVAENPVVIYYVEKWNEGKVRRRD